MPHIISCWVFQKPVIQSLILFEAVSGLFEFTFNVWAFGLGFLSHQLNPQLANDWKQNPHAVKSTSFKLQIKHLYLLKSIHAVRCTALSWCTEWFHFKLNWFAKLQTRSMLLCFFVSPLRRIKPEYISFLFYVY